MTEQQWLCIRKFPLFIPAEWTESGSEIRFETSLVFYKQCETERVREHGEFTKAQITITDSTANYSLTHPISLFNLVKAFKMLAIPALLARTFPHTRSHVCVITADNLMPLV